MEDAGRRAATEADILDEYAALPAEQVEAPQAPIEMRPPSSLHAAEAPHEHRTSISAAAFGRSAERVSVVESVVESTTEVAAEATGAPLEPDESAAMAEAVRRLEAAGVPGAPGDALALIAHAYGNVPRHALHAELARPLPPEVAARFEAAIAARAARQPVAQITGQRPFWRHSFTVTPDTLDPRPETETLVGRPLSLEPFRA